MKPKAKPEKANLTISGIVDRLYKSTDTWSAGKLKRTDEAVNGLPDKDRLVSFTAPIALMQHDSIVLHGAWVYHNVYGSQFVAKDVGYNLQMDSDGLALWLQKNVNIKGIGPAKAKIIADTFGERFDEIITNRPDDIAKSANLNKEAIDNLRTVWMDHKTHTETMLWLAKFGMSIKEIDLILEKFGNTASVILKNNPYAIIGTIPRFAFKKVDNIARKMGIPKGHAGRIREGILWCVNDDIQNGNTWMSEGDLIYKANRLLEIDGLDSQKKISDTVNLLIQDRTLFCRIIKNERAILEPEITAKEEYIAAQIKRRSKTKHTHNEVAYTPTLDLNPQQEKAVRKSFQYKISVIGGGAGTGKTHTIGEILIESRQKRMKVVLCAPTGKAARRMEESLKKTLQKYGIEMKIEARTLHRLLGYNGYKFQYTDDHWREEYGNMEADIVIVDETSMVDVNLAYHLFRAYDDKKTTIVLVGDYHQLPPVGPGCLLRDLVEQESVPITILNDVVRQAGILKTNCTEILSGKMSPTCEPDANGEVPWQLINQFSSASELIMWLCATFEQLITQYPTLDIIRHVQFLAPQKSGDVGVNNINFKMQEIYQRVKNKRDIVNTNEGKRQGFYPGDKIIQTKNNYDIDIMNGNIGQIININGDTMNVLFDGQDQVIEMDRFGSSIQLAYCLTIHKSQGSEFPFVILVVHKAHSFMHTRNLIYTGATRCKKKLIIVGDRWGINNSTKTIDTSKRKTLLGEILSGVTIGMR